MFNKKVSNMILNLIKKTAFTIVCMSISLSMASASDFSNHSQKVPLNPQAKTGKLANGLTYYILENKTPEKYARFRLIVRAGSINEDDDQHGLAHFTEHMAFNGTKRYPKNQLLDFLQKTGLRFGPEINAGTGLESTQYELPMNIENPEMIARAFEILEDWAHNISYDDSQIDSERGVIVSEFRQGNTSAFRLRNELSKYNFHNSKFAHRNVIGDTNLLWNFPYSAIKRFYKDWYRPNLMSVVAVGDFDAAEIEKYIIKHFAGLKNPESERPWEVCKLPSHNTIVGIAKDKETQYDIGRMIFKLPEYDESTVGGYRESIKRGLYDQMFSARLSEIQLKPDPPFAAASAGEGGFLGDKRAYTATVVNKNGEFMKGYNSMLTEIFRVSRHGFTQSELDRAKADYLSAVEKAWNEKSKRHTDQYVEDFTSNFLSTAPVPGFDYQLEAAKYFLKEIKLDEVNQLSKTYITKENCVITLSTIDKESIAVPAESDILAAFGEAWNIIPEPYKDVFIEKPLFAKNIQPGKIKETKTNPKLGIQEVTFENGVRVILKKTAFKDDEILFQAFSPGGSSLASDKDYNSSQQASSIIQQSGIAGFDFISLQKLLTGKQLTVNPFIGELWEGFSGRSTPRDFETALQMINLYFTEPRSDNDAFSNYMNNFRTYVAGKNQNPENVFEDSVQNILNSYHPRRQPFDESYLNSIDFKKAVNFYKDRFADAGDFTFIFVGNIDTASINGMLGKYLGSLPTENRAENWKDAGIARPSKPVEKVVKYGNQDRSHVRLVINGAFDYSGYNMFILQSLKEMFNIRFTEVVREEKAGTYSGSVNIVANKYPKGEYSVVVDFICDPRRVDELTEAVRGIIEELKEEELPVIAEKVKKSQEFRQKLYLERNEYWVSVLNSLLQVGENPETILDYSKWTEDLTAGVLKKAANRYLDAGKMSRFVLLPEKGS